MENTFKFIVDFLKKNKGIGKISNDFNEAIGNEISILWKNIKPIFIREDKRLIEKIESNPDDEVLQGGLKYLLQKKTKDKIIKEEIDRFEKFLKTTSNQNVRNINNSGIVTDKGNITQVGENIAGRDLNINL